MKRNSKDQGRKQVSTTHSSNMRISLQPKYILLICFSIFVMGILLYAITDSLGILPIDKNGMVITTDKEHWLVYNAGTATQPRYRKLCKVNPAQGYSFTKEDFIYNPNNKMFYFHPLNSQEPLQRYYVMAAEDRFDQLARSALENITSVSAPSSASIISTAMVSGRRVSYYPFSYIKKDTDLNKSTFETQAISIYADYGKYTVLFVLEGVSDNVLSDETQTLRIIESMISSLE